MTFALDPSGMSLHCETRGQGPDIVLLHGWGLHGGVWDASLPRLAGNWRVHAVDLPGHGYSRGPLAPGATAADIADAVLARCPFPAIWLGWSLGGLVALAAARRAPQSVRALVLVGATPRFQQSSDWQAGMAAETLAQFVAGLERDYRSTLNRFLSLQLGNGDAERALLRDLRATLFARGEPAAATLRAGLRILAATDLRPDLDAIDVPALVIHGERDRLVPPAAGRCLSEQLAQARLVMVPGAGHAPFLSHPAQFIQALEEFRHDCPGS